MNSPNSLRSRLVLTGIIVTLLFSTMQIPEVFAQATLSVFSQAHGTGDIVDPSLVPGSTSEVDIVAAGTGGLTGFDLTVQYDPTVIGATSYAVSGPGCLDCLFDPFAPGIFTLAADVDSPPGTFRLALVILGRSPTASTGTLVRITFEVRDAGFSPINIREDLTILVNPGAVPYIAQDGSFSNPIFGGFPSVEVLVGYADSVSGPSSFFPSPWFGTSNVVFIGGRFSFDAGAIRIDNPGSSSITVRSVFVELHGSGSTVPRDNPPGLVNLWGSFTIPAGWSAILTQTFEYNFDTSDDPIRPCGDQAPFGSEPFPKIIITVSGETRVFEDRAHVLDTGGFDLSCITNESLQWRPIGTCGIDVPDGNCPSLELSVLKSFTDSELNQLPVDSQGNPKVDVVLANGKVRSTNPGQVLVWITIATTGTVSLHSLRVNETLPVDWTAHPQWIPALGAIHVYFAFPDGTRLEITDSSTVTFGTGNPELVSLSIADLTTTAAGKPLDPGESILLSVKTDYGLAGTRQSASSYPRNYTDTASAAGWSQPSYTGGSSTDTVSSFFTAHAKVLGDVDGNFTVDILDAALAASVYESRIGDARWNPNADFDNTGTIDILDLAVVAFFYGTRS